MIKSFDELRKVDISKHIEQRDGMDYLNWAKCISLLHENGAMVAYFVPCTTQNGSSLIMSDAIFEDKNGVKNRCYEVKVHIVIDELEFDYQMPVMNGTNPVKDNSMSQQRVWNAQTRCFVKGVAMRTGLGFDLWTKEEQATKSYEVEPDDILAIKRRVEKLVTAKTSRGMDYSDLLSALGTSDKAFKTLMGYYDRLNKFEEAIKKL